MRIEPGCRWEGLKPLSWTPSSLWLKRGPRYQEMLPNFPVGSLETWFPTTGREWGLLLFHLMRRHNAHPACWCDFQVIPATTMSLAARKRACCNNRIGVSTVPSGPKRMSSCWCSSKASQTVSGRTTGLATCHLQRLHDNMGSVKFFFFCFFFSLPTKIYLWGPVFRPFLNPQSSVVAKGFQRKGIC